MNLILLFDEDFISLDRVKLSDYRKDHISSILKAKVNDALTVGKCDGLMGVGIVKSIADDVILDVTLTQKPPQALPLTLILALPRPHVLKRTLLAAASFGIKKIIILNFNRVEKSLWNSSSLKPESIKQQLVLGLEQAKDTLMPEVIIKRSFKAFVEIDLPILIKRSTAFVAHPQPGAAMSRSLQGHITLIIGPEGGIIDHELQALTALGIQQIYLGPRILRVETVLPYLLGLLH